MVCWLISTYFRFHEPSSKKADRVGYDLMGVNVRGKNNEEERTKNGGGESL